MPPKRNYNFEKRQKEQARQAKKDEKREEKRQRKLDKTREGEGGEEPAPERDIVEGSAGIGETPDAIGG